MSNTRQVMVRIILIVLTVMVMIFIFRMSSMEAAESSQLSTSVGYTVGEIVIDGFNEMPAGEQQQYVDGIEHPLRKLAHFSEFAALGFLLLFDILAFTKLSGAKRFLTAVILGLIYAATDEYHQTLVSGRSCELKDVMIDVSGVITGCIVATVLIMLFSRLRKNKEY